MRGYDVWIRYNPGCKQVLADTLSRAAVPTGDSEAYEELQEINMVLSVSEERYEEFQQETKVDQELQAVLTMVRNEWPDTKQQVPLKARHYWTLRDEVATADVLFKGTRLIAQRLCDLKCFARSTRVT